VAPTTGWRPLINTDSMKTTERMGRGQRLAMRRPHASAVGTMLDGADIAHSDHAMLVGERGKV